MAIVLDEPTGVDIFLNYALFAGAMFQLMCIFAVIMFSHSNEEKNEEVSNGLTTPGYQSSNSGRQTHDQSSRKGKKEKKKHK